jgi:4-amino-4-deoxy-L-arabinose transferase-like glycosyltransferase
MTEWRRAGLAAAGYAVLALAMMRSLFGQFTTAVPHDLGDPLLSTWILWWNAHRLPFVGSWWDGLSFYPEHGSLAFSDHRVGLEFISGPVQWLGGGPVLAYNITFVACFVLSALAAYALTWTLTRNSIAATISGVVFGFNPYRTAHLAHLELQAAFCLPLALLALHRYVDAPRVRWLVAFSALMALQGLCSGYYVFFSIPLVGLWILWFARDLPWRRRMAIVCAWALAFAVLLPVLLQYRAIQSRLGLGRTFGEMQDFSADLTGLLSAEPGLLLWRVRSLAQNPEAEVYIGVIAPLLVLGAIAGRRRPKMDAPARWPRLRLIVTAVGAVFTAVAISTLWGAWTIRAGPLVVSGDNPAKPLTVVFVAATVLTFTSSNWLKLWRRRSTLAFYTVAAIISWFFSLGPGPRVLGKQFLYRGPYALLMLLPGFDEGFRVPARFIMISALALAVAAGIAFERISASRSRASRLVLTLAVLTLAIADGWIDVGASSTLAISAPPSGIQATAVMELPLGDVFADIQAVYRSTFHHLPVINGYSGYEPAAYQILRLALARRDESILPMLASRGPLLVRIDRVAAGGGDWIRYVQQMAAAVPAGSSAREQFFVLPRQDPPRGPETPFLTIRSVRAMAAPLRLLPTSGGAVQTAWKTAAPQRGGEEIVIELDAPGIVHEIAIGVGSSPLEYPGAVLIETSMDGREWVRQWRNGSGGVAFEAALKNARQPMLRFQIGGVECRFIRVRELWSDAVNRWSISSIGVRGGSSADAGSGLPVR